MKEKLKDIASVSLGYSLRKELSEDGNLRMIQPKDISASYQIDFSNMARVFISNPSKMLLKDGEVLLISRGRFAAVVFKNNINEDIIASSLFLKINPKTNNVSPEYLALYFNSFLGQQALKKISGSVVMPSITKAQLENLEIPIPSLRDQQKLINLTNEFNELKKLNLKKIELETNLVNAIITKTIGAVNG